MKNYRLQITNCKFRISDCRLAIAVALLMAGLLCGCTVTRFESNGVKLARYSFFQAPEIQSVTLATNSATLTGYKNGQDIAPVIDAAVSAAVKAAMQGVKP
jgi:hypothetical protein